MFSTNTLAQYSNIYTIDALSEESKNFTKPLYAAAFSLVSLKVLTSWIWNEVLLHASSNHIFATYETFEKIL